MQSLQNIDASFGDEDIDDKMKNKMLLNVFDYSIPWCPFAGDLECEIGASCTVLTVTIHGTYENQEGTLDMVHRSCMSLSDMAEINAYGIHVSENCHTISEDILTRLYGFDITEPFSGIETLVSELCFCQKDLCNLPTRHTTEYSNDSCSDCLVSIFLLIIMLLSTTLSYLVGISNRII